MKNLAAFSLCAVMSLAVAMSGCGGPSTEPSDSTTPPTDAADDQDQTSTGDASEEVPEEVAVALAELSAEDAVAAKAQKMCPVSGQLLGSMGAPVKVDANGQEVWICCDGCKGMLQDNPDEFLAKLKQSED